MTTASRWASSPKGAACRDANDDLKKAEKDGVINQDEHKRMGDEVQKLTDEAIKHIDGALKTKEQEIMQV